MIKNIIKKLQSAFAREDESLINWLLFSVILIGFLLRLGGITFGLKGELKFFPHPDESNIVTSAFKMLQTGNFNPHPFWVYPTLYIYLQALVQFLVYLVSVGTRSIIPEFANTVTPHHYYYFFGRFLTVIFGTASIFVLYKLAKEIFNKKIGLIAAGLLSVTFVHIWSSQYVTTDVPMTFFGLMSVYFSANILKGDDAWKNYILASVFIGLALATRYNAFIFFVPLIVSYTLTHFKREKFFPYFSFKDFFSGKLILALVSPFLIFIILDPYTVLDLPHFLAEYTGVIRSYRQGIWVQLSVHDNMPAWWWYLKYSASSGLYWPLFLAVLGGLTLGLRSMTKAKILILSYLVSNFLLISSMATVMDRHLIQMAPYLSIFAAIFIFKLSHLFSRAGRWRILRPSFFVFVVLLFGSGLFRAATYDLAIRQPETRVQAAYWLKENLPQDALIVGVGFDKPLEYLRQKGFSRVFSAATLGPSYEKVVDKTKGDHYVIITSVDYNWPKQYYHSRHYAPWLFDGLTAKEIFDGYQKLKRGAVLVKEISDPLFKSGFYGPGYLELSSTITTWHNPTVEIYKVFGVK